MERKELLRNLLKRIFGVTTISISDNSDKESKDGQTKTDYRIICSKGWLDSCTFNITYYNKYKKLFEVALLYENPQYLDKSKNLTFDRERVVRNAKSYLVNRGIHIAEGYTDELQRELIYKLITDYILKAILIADDNDVFENLNTALDNAERYHKWFYIQHLEDIVKESNYNLCLIVDSKLEGDKDINYRLEIDCKEFSSYSTIERLMNLKTRIPEYINKSENVSEPSKEYSIYEFKRDVLFGKFFGNNNSYYDFNLLHINCEKPLQDKIYWGSHLKRESLFSNAKSSSLNGAINTYLDDIITRAHKEAEDKFVEFVKPFYIQACCSLIEIINNITKLKPNDIDIFSGKSKHDNLYRICERFFDDFEIPYLSIERFYNSKIDKGLYITIQNIVIELTDYINNYGTTIAEQFKLILDSKDFKSYKGFIYATLNKLNKLIDWEKNNANNHSHMFTEPKDYLDFYTCYRPNVFYKFQSALYKYSDILKNQFPK